MDVENLNALDGDSMLQEVLNEKIEAQRKAYKRSIKSAVVRNDSAQEALAKSEKRANKVKKKLDDLVNGGLEGYLTIPVDDGDVEEGTCDSGQVPKRTYRLSTRWHNEDKD